MLDALGLEPREQAAYELLVGLPSADAATIARTLDISPSEAADALGRLEALGLVARSSADPDQLVASPPAVALGAIVVQRQEDLRRAQVLVGELGERYREASVGRRLVDIVDVVRGTDAVRQRFLQLQSGARHEVLAFVRHQVVAVRAEDNPAEDQAVDRGVAYRVVVERSVVERPGFYDAALLAQARGEELRVAGTLPSRLLIVDRQVALLPLLGSDGDQAAGALLVHTSGLLETLVAYFDHVWRAAAPLVSRETEPGQLSEIDSRILTLLHTGLTDRAVAHQLRLSLRTVQRRVRALMDVAECDTRLQLGVAAARRGWL